MCLIYCVDQGNVVAWEKQPCHKPVCCAAKEQEERRVKIPDYMKDGPHPTRNIKQRHKKKKSKKTKKS